LATPRPRAGGLLLKMLPGPAVGSSGNPITGVIKRWPATPGRAEESRAGQGPTGTPAGARRKIPSTRPLAAANRGLQSTRAAAARAGPAGAWRSQRLWRRALEKKRKTWDQGAGAKLKQAEMMSARQPAGAGRGRSGPPAGHRPGARGGKTPPGRRVNSGREFMGPQALMQWGPHSTGQKAPPGLGPCSSNLLPAKSRVAGASARSRSGGRGLEQKSRRGQLGLRSGGLQGGGGASRARAGRFCRAGGGRVPRRAAKNWAQNLVPASGGHQGRGSPAPRPPWPHQGRQNFGNRTTLATAGGQATAQGRSRPASRGLYPTGPGLGPRRKSTSQPELALEGRSFDGCCSRNWLSSGFPGGQFPPQNLVVLGPTVSGRQDSCSARREGQAPKAPFGWGVQARRGGGAHPTDCGGQRQPW